MRATTLFLMIIISACVPAADPSIQPDADTHKPTDAPTDASIDSPNPLCPEPQPHQDRIHSCIFACGTNQRCNPPNDDASKCVIECTRGVAQANWCPSGP